MATIFFNNYFDWSGIYIFIFDILLIWYLQIGIQHGNTLTVTLQEPHAVTCLYLVERVLFRRTTTWWYCSGPKCAGQAQISTCMHAEWIHLTYTYWSWRVGISGRGQGETELEVTVVTGQLGISEGVSGEPDVRWSGLAVVVGWTKGGSGCVGRTWQGHHD